MCLSLLLEKMNNPKDAVRVVRESKSIEGAKAVAHYFSKIGDFASAIQFLVFSKCHNAAYELALKHRKMDVYANVIGMDASSQEYKSIAVHFECERNFLLAGKFFLYAKQYAKAVRHLLRVPYSDSSPALDLAIEAVGEAKDKKLTHMVIAYLMGETDGIAKDPRYLFRLYMALQQYREAARTAVIIAREEQNNGNYRNAHDLLFSMVQELRQCGIKVPAEMLDNLSLLHSYILAKLHIKTGNHLIAARLLIRIAQNISKFPSHIVPILTSTVIECHKVNLKHTGFTYASMLLHPEHRDKIDQRYRRKFEGIVRRPEKPSSEEMELLNAASECPFCSTSVPDYELSCGSCRASLPYCTLTGKHVVKNDLTLCPNCDFPMSYSNLITFLENQPDFVCPMCSAPLFRDEVRCLADAVEVLLSWNAGSADPEDDTRTSTNMTGVNSKQDNNVDKAPASVTKDQVLH
uniref:WD repeat-containing protein 19 n=1 Tax=Mesocestoides corti TaxID=53468 RepID=A0A5K3EM40_MESCO